MSSLENATSAMSNSSTASLTLQDDVRLKTILFNTIMAFFIVLTNGIQTLTFYQMKKKTVSNSLFMSISLSDGLFGLIQIPLLTVNQVFLEWPLSTPVCYFYAFYLGLNFSVGNYLILMLSFHRFMQIMRPYDDHEKINRKRIMMMLAPWAAVAIYNACSLIGHVSLGQFNVSNCGFIYSGIFELVQSTILDFIPVTLTVLTNIANIVLLFKRRKNIAVKSIAKTKAILQKTNVATGQDDSNSLANSKAANPTHVSNPSEPHTHADQHNTTHDSSTLNHTDSDTNERVDSNMKKSGKVTKKRFDRDKKAALCIGILVLNALLTEYFSMIMYPVIYLCTCAFDIFSISLYFLFFFPLLNPILVYIFHDTFRAELHSKFTNIRRIKF